MEAHFVSSDSEPAVSLTSVPNKKQERPQTYEWCHRGYHFFKLPLTKVWCSHKLKHTAYHFSFIYAVLASATSQVSFLWILSLLLANSQLVPTMSLLIGYQCLHTAVQQANQRVESPKGPPIRLIIKRCYYGSLQRSVFIMRAVNKDH